VVEPSPSRLFDLHEFPVLYVDDEPENLRIFELGFRRDFHILTAHSAEEALEVLNLHPVAVILSDHRMPGMTGVEFLGHARELDPRAIRILVTAYGDAETLGQAINDGSIYRYIPKPWDPVELRLTLRRAIEVYALDREREALVRELSTVNRIASTVNRELSLQRVLNLSVEALTQQLEYDGAALLLLSQSGEALRFERMSPAIDAVAEQLREHVIPMEKAPHFFADLLRGESRLLELTQLQGQEAPVRDWLTEVAADQILVVPLLGKQGTLGALAVDNRRGSRALGVGDRTLLEGVATQIAVALQNAQLVDDLRKSRMQVLRAERLGTLGTLAAGLAHEINNPLVSIHTFLSLALEKRHEEDLEFWGDYHRLACQEVERIRGLVNTMSKLGRSTEERAPRALCTLGSLAQEVVTLVGREARRAGVAVEVEAGPAEHKVLAAREQLHQLLLNLLLNAIQASPQDGTVCVRVRQEPGQDGEVLLEVSDQGQGIAEEDLDRIFDPFFTTKGPDQGTGLGLMICHHIVESHGGSIEVASRPGCGATFRVRLPRGSS